MSQLRDEAEALALALEIGACDVAEVIAWSDAQVLGQSPPLGALCELSLAHERYPQDVAAMLRQLPGEPAKSNVSDLLLTLISAGLKDDMGRAGRVASALYHLALADKIEDSQLRDIAGWAWDALDLAEEGLIQESHEQVVSQIADELDRAAARAVVTWSFGAGARGANYDPGK